MSAKKSNILKTSNFEAAAFLAKCMGDENRYNTLGNPGFSDNFSHLVVDLDKVGSGAGLYAEFFHREPSYPNDRDFEAESSGRNEKSRDRLPFRCLAGLKCGL